MHALLVIMMSLACLLMTLGYVPMKSSLNIKSRTAGQFSLNLLPQYTSLESLIDGRQLIDTSSFLVNSEEISGYSNLSLYFTLALYVLTLPGLYSLITRSVNSLYFT